MSTVILTGEYPPPPFCEGEILRYAGCKAADPETAKLVLECISEAESALTYKVCWCELSVAIKGNVCDFGAFSVTSQNLANNLGGCNGVLLFAATVGVGLDRLISKYSHISPVKALIMQAVGAERIEALCNAFCADASAQMGATLKPRFSAGYGDLPLETQRDIFAVLNPAKHIGLTLNNSLLMSPTKSVTAFAGIGETI